MVARLLRLAASRLTVAADRIDPPQESHSAFVDRLAAEAHDELFSPEFRASLEAAMDRVYADRPTAYTRKLRAIQGGRR